MTSKKENDVAPLRSRSGPRDAAVRGFDKATDISFRTTYTEVSEPYDFTVDFTTRRDGKRLIGVSAGDAGIEWPGELLDWLIIALTRIKAARSESEDTQAKPTPSQADVDALVKAGAAVVAAKDTMEGVRHLDPVADALAIVAARTQASGAVEAIRTALTPFQKG